MKTILITGTSSGIGKAAALLFQKRGWQVAAIMRETDNDSELMKLDNVRCYQVDVRDKEMVESCVQTVINDFGKIDVLLNNAAVLVGGPVESASDDGISRIIETNIIGYIHMTRAVVPHFRSRKAGKLIYVSSLSGRMTLPYQSLYHGTKYAVEGFSEGLVYEMKQIGAAVKIIEPGMVKTNFYDDFWDIKPDEFPGEYRGTFNNWQQFMMKDYEYGISPHQVARTIYRAAVGRSSRLRYTVGPDIKMALFFKSVLPFSVFCLLVYHLTAKKIGGK